jgi:hypothetical protein
MKSNTFNKHLELIHHADKDLYEQSMNLIAEIELLEKLGKDATEQEVKLIEISRKMVTLERVLYTIFHDDAELDI